MIPKTTSIFWFTAWRIGVIVLLLSLIGYIVWLQRYTFTDQDVTDLCGASIFRTSITTKDGQKLCFGRQVDGIRSAGASSEFKAGTQDAVIAVSYRDRSLTVSLLFRPPLADRVPDPAINFLTRSLSSRIDDVKSNGVAIAFDEQPDGSVWLAEWEEVQEGQKKKINYGYWIE
ncbi:hypothetical protein K2Y11_23490 [bacterium]|nr:hypothetical protein [bacterium]